VIPFLDLTRQHAALRGELLAATERVLASSQFVLGGEGRALESALAELCGARHALGVGSGTDALRLALAALGVGAGDEVLTPAFSFVASATTIVMAGATPVFVDVDPETLTMDPAGAARALTLRTKAIIPVHLYGHPADLDALTALARRHAVALLEDAAQAVGATWRGRPIGGWGDAACLSFYPTKNLGACGDAGMLLTTRDDVAERVKRLRHHGDAGRYQHVELGYCSRLDELQAALLRVKLRHLREWEERRRAIAARYREGLTGLDLTLPVERAGARHVYHLFTVRHPRRDDLVKRLADAGVGTAVHYPRTVPGQPLFAADDEKRWPEAWRAAREVVSLPCYPEMTDVEIETVVAAVRRVCEALG
jgi:dTDP-4-amino-4,6-dideoxygalactose transaminase